MPNELFDLAERFFPSYLLPKNSEDMLRLVKEFPHQRGYYTRRAEGQLAMQGDGWSNFVVLNFFNGERKTVSGIVLSNSCDISPDNTALPNQRVVFAPLIRLAKFIEVLREGGRSDRQIADVVERLQKQHVLYAFYLPACDGIDASVALLDDVHSLPIEHFNCAEKHRLFRLSDFGFWLFLMKISMHFTRFNEHVNRGVHEDRVDTGVPGRESEEEARSDPERANAGTTTVASEKPIPGLVTRWIQVLRKHCRGPRN